MLIINTKKINFSSEYQRMCLFYWWLLCWQLSTEIKCLFNKNLNFFTPSTCLQNLNAVWGVQGGLPTYLSATKITAQFNYQK